MLPSLQLRLLTFTRMKGTVVVVVVRIWLPRLSSPLPRKNERKEIFVPFAPAGRRDPSYTVCALQEARASWFKPLRRLPVTNNRELRECRHRGDERFKWK
ncbi:hypothetical protein F5Y17DRAFT_232272 [Xylariaceae sp. FL0594]|nr:hypothetical protein F5Y17DRAFT_232272 [Xylariaceae sp. FL0594]